MNRRGFMRAIAALATAASNPSAFAKAWRAIAAPAPASYDFEYSAKELTLFDIEERYIAPAMKAQLELMDQMILNWHADAVYPKIGETINIPRPPRFGGQ